MGLRSRLILSFVLVITVCLGIIAGSLYLLAGESLNRLAGSRLADMALPVYLQARVFLRSQAALEQAWPNIEEQASTTGVCMFLCGSDGTILRQTSNVGSDCAFPASIFPKRAGPVVRPLRGSFAAADGKTYVYAAFPLTGFPRLRENSGVDWLVLSTSPSGTSNMLTEIFKPVLLAGLVALVISIILAILLARSVYKPIGRVRRAAVEMAAGKYDQQVPLEGPGEVKQLASSFNDMAGKVKDSQQALRDFVADVSHELRTPLTSIRGFAQAIQDGTAQSKEASARAAAIIEEEARRMIRLVNNLLQLSRLESGQLEIKKELVDLLEVIQQCQEVFSIRAEEKQIFLVTDLEPLPQVYGDIDRLEQVFDNLLDNAIKHTPKGGTVTLQARHITAETVQVSVSDTGPGIPQEQLPHVFKRFYRGYGPGERTGTGLGLAISHQIVLAHGGDIRVNSRAEQGAEFIVRLPVMNELRIAAQRQARKGKT
jgi:signal transduction histidine kinase